MTENTDQRLENEENSDHEPEQIEDTEDDSAEPFNWTKAIKDPENAEWLDVQHARLREIPEKVLDLPKCDYVCFRYNLIKDMSNVSYLNPAVLTELDLYDNNIKEIAGISELVNLKSLDISYNNLKALKRDQLIKLVNLEKLYLCANNIKSIPENVFDGQIKNLEVLELGANKIKKIENLPNFEKLRELHLAKNKISTIENLPESLKPTLKVLTLQENRIINLDYPGLGDFEILTELYLSANYITNESFAKNTFNNSKVGESLEILDLSSNKTLTKLDNNLSYLKNISDLWLNSCGLLDWKDLDVSLGALKDNLDTVYMEHNPLQQGDAGYRRKLKLICPNLTQIDATSCL